jgi:hypothetical protein
MRNRDASFISVCLLLDAGNSRTISDWPESWQDVAQLPVTVFVTVLVRGQREQFCQLKNAERAGPFAKLAIGQMAQITVQEHQATE